MDNPLVVTGQAQFGMDAVAGNAGTQTVSRCPVDGGKIRSFDAGETLAVPGVKDVRFAIEEGIAVVASTTWAVTITRRVEG